MNLETVITGEEECANPDFPGYWYWAALPYTVKPSLFGDDVFPDDDIDGVVIWCAKHFGIPQSPGHKIKRRWRKSGFTTFHFREEKDRDWFLMRWS